MLKEIVLFGHMSSGHGCWPARPNDQASDLVEIEGLGVHLVGHHWAEHCCPAISECHDGVAQTSSSLFTVDGVSVTRKADLISCGDTMAQGSDLFWVDD